MRNSARHWSGAGGRWDPKKTQSWFQLPHRCPQPLLQENPQMYYLHLYSPPPPLPAIFCSWMRSERAGKRMFHAPHRHWQHKATAALLSWKGLDRERLTIATARPGVEENCWVWGVEASGNGGGWEGGLAPKAARSVPQLPRVSVEVTETTSDSPEHPNNELHPCLAKLSYFQEKGGKLFSSVHNGKPYNSTWEAIYSSTPGPAPFPSHEGQTLSAVVPHPYRWSLSILTLSPPGLLLLLFCCVYKFFFFCLFLFVINLRYRYSFKKDCYYIKS